MKLSLIIPVLNESETINKAIESIVNQNMMDKIEIVVVDGDLNNSTIKCIKDKRVVKTDSPPGRSTQMNKGASIAKGDTLLFLHSDTIVPEVGFK